MNPRDDVRFWRKVWKTDTCWAWLGWADPKGYGTVGRNGVRYRSHRYSWEMHRGPIPAGMTIDHLCRNTFCVNPDHMEVVTMRENILRGDGPSARNARKTHCPKGHELSLVAPGQRGCRVCRARAYVKQARKRGYTRTFPLTHCRRGHAYEGANVVWHGTKRYCLGCRRINKAAYTARLRDARQQLGSSGEVPRVAHAHETRAHFPAPPSI